MREGGGRGRQGDLENREHLHGAIQVCARVGSLEAERFPMGPCGGASEGPKSMLHHKFLRRVRDGGGASEARVTLKSVRSMAR
jgi:hypothetical protein